MASVTRSSEHHTDTVSSVPRWRTQFFESVNKPLDVLVIGGGITGAGVLHAVAKLGLLAALVEQKDFAYGSSSRSSKLVHGGLRYLKQAQVHLMHQSLREREALLHEYPELIHRLRFFLPHHHAARIGMKSALRVYDSMAGIQSRNTHNRASLIQHFPFLQFSPDVGALSYLDAQTDDAQLVMKELQLAEKLGALSANYVSAQQLIEHRGRVLGALVRDEISAKMYDIRAHVVVNATGAWASELQANASAPLRLRPLRGSHLVLPFARLPLVQAIAKENPIDKRPMFALPWMGEVIFGTTDVEHKTSLNTEPRMSCAEYDYLMDALQYMFPQQNLQAHDVLSSFAGVRPTVADSHALASANSREHMMVSCAGYITVTGGKLTTYRRMAAQVITEIRKQVPMIGSGPSAQALAPEKIPSVDTTYWQGTHMTKEKWAQCAQQKVMHLDDLLIRRSHIGLLRPNGALNDLDALQAELSASLGWSAEQWQAECIRYRQIYQESYRPKP